MTYSPGLARAHLGGDELRQSRVRREPGEVGGEDDLPGVRVGVRLCAAVSLPHGLRHRRAPVGR